MHIFNLPGQKIKRNNTDTNRKSAILGDEKYGNTCPCVYCLHFLVTLDKTISRAEMCKMLATEKSIDFFPPFCRLSG